MAVSNGVPRVWKPAESCPDCRYPDDAGFQFCQRCGFRTPAILPSSAERVSLDMPAIDARFHSLRAHHKSKPYQRQKSKLQLELERIIRGKPKYTLIIVLLLVPVVQPTVAPVLGTRLAAATVENFVVEMKSNFAYLVPSGGNLSALEQSNPISHPVLKDYLRSIREEQAQAPVSPKQAAPLAFGGVLSIGGRNAC
ncbi:Hypothetical predicted protein [Paramuricea clavata]|uniref:Uncharacterized protein n=1 Tax=Paramuricea clavata TaxID=317549 RepID=A0A7D9DTK3_PARCT|nr:Hypothetical predicted protein [Paramuricea clavata]